ncbi:putative oxysterol-binding protein [Helianthus annuus]|uniref:Oxysterol-binding protein n=2 Tax=Helianthus annuus TaxID=4232 RepID=A0A251UFC1_HELAN|nr:oxysterol-binding protein-related protein 2A isoform X1 [Helianthus annuus]KAF5800623.1 putative oxysterol-binding protein [Helianthus annuus]KAJ0564887.1 putative oxysterol-binding protein [Helianthus annuus]KAJ0571963.1 putative oxysterol-binding protein [Helianthus annuus]KAJ0913710.1 putative oxysterol-binding protein [Helianthus annuus]
MRVKEMHPLCCISLETPAAGDHSPDLKTNLSTPSCTAAESKSDANAVGMTSSGSESCSGDKTFAGVLYKWTNYGKGWRSRWFLLRNGVISYSKILHPESLSVSNDVRFIGDVFSGSRRSRRHKQQKTVHLKVSSFRESRSDDRRFYIFTATKTLHLRTRSKKERVAWIEALASTKNLFTLRQLNDKPSVVVRADISLSTERLKKRLLEEGISDVLVKDCEQIMLLEFSDIQEQIKLLCEERSNLLDTLRQLEAANIDVEASGDTEREYQLTREDFSDLQRDKYIEWSTTESSDDVDKQELEDASEDEEIYFYDTQDCFPELANQAYEMAECEFERRKKLPDPAEKEKGVSLWSLIKDNVGKDLTRVCLPVYFNEPISSLQKCFEDLEYSYLLDRAYHHGKQGDSLQRVLNVAAFAVSGYASSEGRHCKPFNPLLGETYEADYPERGVRFFSEKVSHHPTLIACHSEGKGWKFWGDSNIRTKFWGRSIQLDPVGVLTLEFDDGEVFQWSKVTTSIYNLILGKVYCDHHGMMHIRGNREYSCKLKFKEQSILERNPRQVHGFVEDASGKKHATLFGKWDDSMYYINGVKPKDAGDANLLWQRTMPPANLTRYNLTSFAITLNELTPGLKEKLPPTDSRLRPDQRHLENGEYDMANAEKLRLETRQRMSRKLQENGWKPRWFEKDGENGTYRYVGGYWEKREDGRWDDCPNIFGECSQEMNESSSR